MPGRLVVPEFEIRIPFADAELTGVHCTRCGETAWVDRDRWLASMPGYQTRSCTYCFKVGKIPDELWRMMW